MLIDAVIDQSLTYVSFRADSAAEMLAKLNAFIATEPGESIVDFELKATGAAPFFLATLVLSSDPGTVPSIDGDTARFLIVGGVGGIDPLALVDTLQTQIQALGATELNKVEIAGGGAGPHWMAAAIYNS